MPTLLRVHFAGVLLLAAPFLAAAESPLYDPIPPAVVGRPLDQIQPARTVRKVPAKSAAAKPKRPAPVVISKKNNAARPVAAAAAAAPAVAVAAVPQAPAPAATQPVPAQPAAQHAAKQAVDDRADPNARVVDDVGKGTRLARKRLAPGVYLGSKSQELVRRYYEAHPAPKAASHWQIGEPLPPKAPLSGVPDDLRAALPVVPPGHQYVQLGGDVVLVAVQSRIVVDGVSRSAR